DLAWSESAAFSTSDGRFVLRGLSAGHHKLTFAGAFVAERRDATVAAGGVTDLGVITVRRGRALRGKGVRDGVAVAGANVVASPMFLGDGTRMNAATRLSGGGMRSAVTAGDGSFTIDGVDDAALVVAEHPVLGRSRVVRADANIAVLSLEPTGTLRGRITRSGRGVEASLSAT